MGEVELDGWLAAIQQLTRLQSAGASGAPADSKRIVSKRRRQTRQVR